MCVIIALIVIYFRNVCKRRPKQFRCITNHNLRTLNSYTCSPPCFGGVSISIVTPTSERSQQTDNNNSWRLTYIKLLSHNSSRAKDLPPNYEFPPNYDEAIRLIEQQNCEHAK